MVAFGLVMKMLAHSIRMTGEQQVKACVAGFLPPVWETNMEFLASDFSLAWLRFMQAFWE